MEPNTQLAQLEALQAAVQGRGNFAGLKSLNYAEAAALYDRFDAIPPDQRTPAISAALLKAHAATPTPAEQSLPQAFNAAKLAQVRTFFEAMSGPQ